MSGVDVRVDYDAVSEIARRIRSEALGIDATKLRAPDESQVGHARLADALTHFAGKWNAGVEKVQDSTEHLAANIALSVETYRDVDGQVAGEASSTGAQPE